jgi:acyl carrier protein
MPASSTITKNEVVAYAIEVIQRDFEVGEVTEASRFEEDLDLDSLDVVEVLFALGEHFSLDLWTPTTQVQGDNLAMPPQLETYTVGRLCEEALTGVIGI